MNVIGAGAGFLFAIIYLVILGMSIYCFILFIKLAIKGIEALDNYNSTFRNKY